MLQGFVVGVDAELRAPEVVVETLHAPHDAARLQVQWRPMPLEFERSAADDVHERADRTIELLLLERPSKPIDLRVVVQAKRSTAVEHSIPIQINQDGRGGELRQEFPDNFFHLCGELERRPLFYEDRDGPGALSHLREELAVVAGAPKQRPQLLLILGHGHFGQSLDLVTVVAYPIRGDGVFPKNPLR